MKRLLLALCVLLSLPVLADTRTKTSTFDFSNPESLSPAVTRNPDTGGGLVNVTDKTFTSSDGLTIHFDNSKVSGRYPIYIQNVGGVCHLRLDTSAELIITANDDIRIKGVRFPGTDVIEGVTLIAVGTTSTYEFLSLNDTQTYYSWTYQGTQSFSSLTFANKVPAFTQIHQVLVDYELPSEVLSVQSASIADNSTIHVFDGIQLTFAENMTVTNDAQCTLSDGTHTTELTATANGKVVTVAPAHAITEDGTYTLTVKAGSFADSEGFYNKEWTCTFTIVKSFDILSINPAAGGVDDIPASITLTFAGEVGAVNGNMNVDVVDANGNLKRRGHAQNAGDNQVLITFDNTTPITSNGIYTLVIPEGLVKDAAGVHYNLETTFDYNIGNIASDELKQQAAALLAKTGLGYPAANSTARQTLAGLAANATTAAYTNAINDYLATTDVVMPGNGSYYYIAAQSASGEKVYLQYTNGEISLTTSEANAVPLKAVLTTGKYSFVTPDNQNLLLPGASLTGVTASNSVLTVAKLSSTRIDVKDAFGLFSIQGEMDGRQAYARIHISTPPSFASDPDLGLSYLTTTYTNGFVFEEVDEADIPVPDVQYELTPATGSSVALLTTVTVTFPSLTSVALANKGLISLTHDNGTTLYPSTVTKVANTQNAYVLTFNNVRSGKQTLTIGKGAFSYNYVLSNNTTIAASVQTITATYTVTTGDDFRYDLTTIRDIYYKEYTGNVVNGTYLNTLTLYSNEIELGVSDEEVLLVHFNTNDIIRRGHLVVATDKELPDAKGIVKLQLNDTIEAGTLATGQYSIVIPAGTFGDDNFAAYIKNPAAFLATGKTKADCHVNPRLSYLFDVSNSQQGGDTPGPEEPATPSAAVLAKANELLKNTGVGYPSAKSQSRRTLQNQASTGKGSDDIYQSMMAAFVEDTDIEKPAEGSYYTIKGVSADGTEAYVRYGNGTLSLTQNAAEASAFQAANGGMTLKTLDGNYVSVLSPDGVSATADATHSLLFERLKVNGADAEKTFGLMSITGLKDNDYLSAKVNTATLAILPPASGKVFAASETSGFRFTEISEADIPAPTPEFTLTPADNARLESFQDVTVSFTGADNISVADLSLITLTSADGTNINAISAQEKQPGMFTISFPSNLESGTYTLNIAKGAFTFKFMQRTVNVQSIMATYILNIRPSDDMLDWAKRELAKKGIGYPTADSEARLALQQLVESGIGSNAVFQKALNAYFADTNVEKPATGKFYRITANSLSKQSYLGYEKGTLSLTNDQNKAAAFMATVNADGTTSFTTIDGKYLMLLTKDGSNVSENPVNLTVARLAGSELDVTETYGLLSMSAAGAYATVDLSTSTFRDPQSSPILKSYTTSGFAFVEIDKESIVMPDIEYTLSPEQGTEVESLEKVKLTFNTKVTLTDKNLVKLVKFSGEIYTPTAVEQTKDNEYVFTFINLKKDTYKLTIDKGAFTTTFLDEQRPVQAITANYTLTKSVEFVAGYEKEIQLSWAEDPQSDYMMDTELNTFTLVSSVPLSFNPDKAVIIRNANSYQEVARGHMVPVDIVRSNAEGITDYAYGLVLDKPITEGSIESGQYAYVFEKELFGDSTFGEYLAEPTQVSKADCHVNGELVFNVKVNNVRASVMAVEHTVSPAAGSVETIDKVTLTFTTDDKVTLADPSLLSLTISGKSVEPKDIKMTDDKTCELTFVNLEMGTYYLTVGKGAFTINHRGKERQVDGFMVSYTLTKSVDFATGYEKEIELTWQQDPKGQYVKDSDLNKFTLLSNTPLVINPNNTVIIRDATYYTVVARGHMEMDPVDKVRGNAEATADYVYTLVLDQQIADNSLAASTYEYVLAKETFGDATYGDYLANPTKVSKADCHVNAEMRFAANVNNKIAVGVREIGADADDAPVYDVYGRKVSGQLKKGTIYVKNGKKFMKK